MLIDKAWEVTCGQCGDRNHFSIMLVFAFVPMILFIACAAITSIPTPISHPTESLTSPVRVTMKSQITDKATHQPVRGVVKLDGKVVFNDVSYFELVLPADLREKPVFVRVEALGYQPWEQGYRHYWKTNKVYEFPVELERVESN